MPEMNDIEVSSEDTDKEPWNMDWGVSGMMSPQEEPTSEVPPPNEPWNQDWGIQASMTPIFQEASPQGGGDGFQNVFNRLIQAESRGRHMDASGKLTTSPTGAKGISQIMPATGRNPGFGIQPLQNESEEEYLRVGREYLQAMLGEFNGDFRKAVAAYNAGPGNVQKAITQAQSKGGDWTQYLPKKSETIPYMNRVLGEGIRASAESEFIPEVNLTREQLESIPKVTLGEIVSMGLSSKQGREDWLKDKRKEYRKSGKEDRLGGFFAFLGREYPSEVRIYNAMQDNPDVTEEELAVSGDKAFSFVPMRRNISGFVLGENPDRAFISSSTNKGTDTRLHEIEHLRQAAPGGLDNMRIASSILFGPINVEALGNRDHPINQFRRAVTEMKADPRVKEVFSAGNAFKSLNELLANYSAFGTREKQDMFKSELFDALSEKVGKKKATEMIRAANSFTLTDIPQFTESQAELSGNLRKEIEGDKSYAQQLFLYLQNLLSTEEK